MDLPIRPFCVAPAGTKDDVEESGWKMVSGDVFRSPKNATLLCVQLGSGVQIILSAFITLFFAALGALLGCICPDSCHSMLCGTPAVRPMC